MCTYITDSNLHKLNGIFFIHYSKKKIKALYSKGWLHLCIFNVCKINVNLSLWLEYPYVAEESVFVFEAGRI
jgi:hypothetical protein